MILITTFLLTVVNFVNGNDWFYLAHGAGAPVRCVPGGNGIECASDDGVNCKWGTYGAQTPYSQMSGVTASNPLAISCPGWVPTDGSNACAVLGCSDEFTWYFLDHSTTGAPGRCSPSDVDHIECASDDGVNCKWGTYGSGWTAYEEMTDVVGTNPLSIPCPGWAINDGSDACKALECYEHPWFYLAHGAGAPVRCVPGGDGIECASNDGVNCKWGTYGAQTPYSQMSGVTASNPLAISCPGWIPTDNSNACAVLGCSDEFTWYFLDHSTTGAPGRCSPAEDDYIECASDDGVNCKWGTYGSGWTEYEEMTDVVGTNPLSIPCPGWAINDGSDACDNLACYTSCCAAAEATKRAFRRCPNYQDDASCAGNTMCRWIGCQNVGFCRAVSGARRTKKRECKQQIDEIDCDAIDDCFWTEGEPPMEYYDEDLDDEGMVLSVGMSMRNGVAAYDNVYGLLLGVLASFVIIWYGYKYCKGSKKVETETAPLIDRGYGSI